MSFLLNSGWYLNVTTAISTLWKDTKPVCIIWKLLCRRSETSLKIMQNACCLSGIDSKYGFFHHPVKSLQKLCSQFWWFRARKRLFAWWNIFSIQIVSSDSSHLAAFVAVEAVSSCGVFLCQQESVMFKASVGSSIVTHNNLHEITSQRKSPPPTSVYLFLHPTISSPPPLKLCGGRRRGQRGFWRHWVRCSTNGEFWETATCQV